MAFVIFNVYIFPANLRYDGCATTAVCFDDSCMGLALEVALIRGCGEETVLALDQQGDGGRDAY